MNIRKTSTVNRSMNRALRDATNGLNDVINYHLRQIEILYENRSEGDREHRVYSRPTLQLRQTMVDEILTNVEQHVIRLRCESEFIDIMLKTDNLTDDEGIIYTQKDRVKPIARKGV